MIAAAMGAGFMVFGLSLAFFLGGRAAVSSGHLEWMSLLFLAIVVFWQILPIFVAGFGVNFEFRSLLRFPLSLKAFYLISLAYGFADLAPISSVFWLIAMTLGATTAKASIAPAMTLISALVLLMSVTLERLISSWVEKLLARRATRELMLGLVILLSISAQLIKPIIDHFHSG